MVRTMKVKHVVVGLNENILDEFNVEHCGFKVKVTLALAMFNHLIIQITSRCLFIAGSGKCYSNRYQLYISYTVRHVVGKLNP